MLNFIYRFLLISLIIGIIINVFSNYIFKRNNLEDIIDMNIIKKYDILDLVVNFLY